MPVPYIRETLHNSEGNLMPGHSHQHLLGTSVSFHIGDKPNPQEYINDLVQTIFRFISLFLSVLFSPLGFSRLNICILVLITLINHKSIITD